MTSAHPSSNPTTEQNVCTLHTPDGPYYYTEQELFHGRKKLNLQISRENLLLFRSVLQESGVRYGLLFGTLLGLVREGDLIAHDEDVDVYVLEEDKQAFLGLLFSLRAQGLQVCRVQNDFLSLIRENDYIDVYFVRPVRRWGFWRYRAIEDKYRFPERYLTEIQTRTFYGEPFQIPRNPERVLRLLYGKGWRVPVVGYHAPANNLWFYIKHYLKKVGIHHLVPKAFRSNHH